VSGPSVTVRTVSNDGNQAGRDAHHAWTYAVNLILLKDQGGIPGRTPADVLDNYATDLLDQLNGSPERVLAAARAACISAAEQVANPDRWRPAIRAVELCRRAAELADAA
jgi:hypothetical protein